jgi:hypothetical protein
MLASVEKRFVLLCNPKTGTTSLEAAFRPYAEIRVGGTPKLKHIGYDRLCDLFGSYFQDADCKIYAVARDPIETLVSWYKYRARDALKDPRHPYHKNYTGNMSFSQFVEAWSSRKPPTFAKIPVIEWCLTREEQIAPLVYYRYESIDALVAVLSDHVGARPRLKHLNASPPTTLTVDRQEIEAIPKMQQALDVYMRIPFVK